MRILFSLFLILFYNLISAQNNHLTFDKQFVYGLINENEINSDFKSLKINLYVDSSNSIGLVDIYSSYLKSDLNIFKKGKLLKLNPFSFENNQISVNNEPRFFSRMQVIDSLLSSKITFEGMNKKGHFLGFNCDYYKIKSDILTEKFMLKNNNCICIDSTNINKNVKLIFPNSNIDGLILGYSFVESLDNMIVIEEIKNIEVKTFFDFENQYFLAENNFNQFIKRLNDEKNHVFEYDKNIIPPTKAIYVNYTNDPLCNSYLYFKEFDLHLRNIADQFTKLGCELFYDNQNHEKKDNDVISRNLVIKIAKSQTDELLKQAIKAKVINKNEGKKLAKAFEIFYEKASNFILIEDEM